MYQSLQHPRLIRRTRQVRELEAAMARAAAASAVPAVDSALQSASAAAPGTPTGGGGGGGEGGGGGGSSEQVYALDQLRVTKLLLAKAESDGRSLQEQVHTWCFPPPAPDVPHLRLCSRGLGFRRVCSRRVRFRV